MASVYVHSGAAGAGTGADWANAYTTLAAALAAKAAGDTFYVAHDHAETQATNIILTSPGTAASPCRVICANRAGSVPPVSADLATTATISTTGASSISFREHAYYRGITFTSANSTNTPTIFFHNAASGWSHLELCALVLGGTSGIGAIQIGGSGNFGVWVLLDNTTVQFATTGDTFNVVVGRLWWRRTVSAIQGATFPLFLFANSTGQRGGDIFVEGVDLSALVSGKGLVGSITAPTRGVFKDCKLGSSVTVAATPPGPGGSEVLLIRCDSGDTNYRTEKYRYEGTQTIETTIVRSGGASDGTTPVAWKLVTTANSKRHLPFEALPISIWNETTGSPITLTVEGIWGGGAVPTNANIWMDAEYLGTSGFPLGSFATSGPADQLAAGTNLSAGSGTWGGSTTKFKLEKTITPQEKGPITVYVKAALASSTFFIDPKIAVS